MELEWPRNKQTKNFSLNWNKPKQDMFWFCFGLLYETKNKKFRFVSVFRTYIETIETNRINPKFSKQYQNMLSIKLFRLVFCLFWFNRNIETNPNKIRFGFVSVCFVKPKTKKFWYVSVFRTYIETIETNRTFSKQTESTLNFPKNTKICSLSNCFGWSSVCFDSIETLKLFVSV